MLSRPLRASDVQLLQLHEQGLKVQEINGSL